jgi:hypothetical protein
VHKLVELLLRRRLLELLSPPGEQGLTRARETLSEDCPERWMHTMAF